MLYFLGISPLFILQVNPMFVANALYCHPALFPADLPNAVGDFSTLSGYICIGDTTLLLQRVMSA